MTVSSPSTAVETLIEDADFIAANMKYSINGVHSVGINFSQFRVFTIQCFVEMATPGSLFRQICSTAPTTRILMIDDQGFGLRCKPCSTIQPFRSTTGCEACSNGSSGLESELKLEDLQQASC